MKKSFRFKKRSQNVGFTLIELVITIAIVIILSVISVPIYRGYVDKAKYAEGYALLGQILSAQKAYFSEYGNFLRDADCCGHTCNDTVLGIDARGNKYFTYFYGGSGMGNGKFYTESSADKPMELRSNGQNFLRFQYNTTRGAIFGEIYNTTWKF